jgi:hypothetical protein
MQNRTEMLYEVMDNVVEYYLSLNYLDMIKENLKYYFINLFDRFNAYLVILFVLLFTGGYLFSRGF